MLDEEGTLTFPENKTEIDDYEFGIHFEDTDEVIENKNRTINFVKKIIIGPFIKKIGICAFSSCIYLEELDFSNANELELIHDMAFMDCSKIKNLYLPENIKHIGTYSFGDCNNLTHVDLKGIISIYHNSFMGAPISYFNAPLLEEILNHMCFGRNQKYFRYDYRKICTIIVPNKFYWNFKIEFPNAEICESINQFILK